MWIQSKGLRTQYCVSYATAEPGSAVHRTTCSLEDLRQRWLFAADGTLRPSPHTRDVTGGDRGNAMDAGGDAGRDPGGGGALPLCMEATANGVDSGSRIQLATCTAGAAHQRWWYHAGDSTVQLGVASAPTGMCLDGFKVQPGNAPVCSRGSPAAALPVCNTSLPNVDRIADLLKRLSDEEAAGLLGNRAQGVVRLGISPYQWWNEATHGVGVSPGVTFGRFGTEPSTPLATSFPVPLVTAASFNASLFQLIGAAVGTEARAFNSVGHAGLTYWAYQASVPRYLDLNHAPMFCMVLNILT